jgi:hypothetical protein
LLILEHMCWSYIIMRDCVYSLNNCVYTNESVTGPEMHQEFVMSIYGLNLLAASVWNRHRHSSLDTLVATAQEHLS